MSLTNASPEAAAAEAKTASFSLATLPTSARNDALQTIHDALAASKDEILAANARDLELAQQAAKDGSLSQALVSRLDLGKKGKWDDMLKGILDVKGLPDPIGKLQMKTQLDDDLILERVSSPIGVLLIIFEARPEVIANIASLAIKSGNAAILKVISSALDKTQVPNAAIQLVTTRDAISSLLSQDKSIDLVIPRGSNDLVRYIKENTKIPVMGHADGLCAIYLAASADKDKAVKAIVDAKTDYPAACNALETLLVQDSTLSTIFPAVASGLAAKGVTLHCDEPSKAAISALNLSPFPVDATPADYTTEFLSLDVAVKTVSSLQDAINHINHHSSGHTDCIMTSDPAEAERFMSEIDSAGVYWNASTRFADGMRYGFGTEVGISTNKIHARGPVGLEGLTIYKYKVRGNYQAASDYGSGEGQRQYKHISL
ncbi:hypothetical protein NLU13_5511 [Sarocladium strictum]|uniref:glutamate-5-semialdehyde dehydrogenase n=1 Tax=Sarocladium strictum TaxID=5046 RepID=A0AA39L7P6_SARSR|nr:hypothetical protein NLU13_5511 [Sarocladium strictum]